MTGYLPSLPILTALAYGAYWVAVILFMAASLCLAVIAMRRPTRPLVYASTSALVLALFSVAVPGPVAPVGIVPILGILSVALAVVGGGPAVQLVLSLASRGTVSNGIFGGIVVADREPESGTGSRGTHEVLRGGTAIGYLERLATIGAILAGFPEAIAVIVAIKSVGRFSELDAAEARERFIIGTLVSLTWACACAAVVHFAAS